MNLLREKGFAKYDKDTGRDIMMPISDMMEPSQESYPNNLLHLFGVTVDDFGIEDDE
jgi:hypothetical protein